MIRALTSRSSSITYENDAKQKDIEFNSPNELRKFNHIRREKLFHFHWRRLVNHLQRNRKSIMLSHACTFIRIVDLKSAGALTFFIGALSIHLLFFASAFGNLFRSIGAKPFRWSAKRAGDASEATWRT